MLKLALLAVVVLLILGAIIYFTFRPSQNPNTSTPQEGQNTQSTDIKIEDIKIKQPVKPMFSELFAPSQTKASGYVRLSDVAGKVLIQLKSDDTTDTVAMVYKGTCDQKGESIYPLVILKQGKSQTVWDTTLDSIANQLPLSVKVFTSSKDLNTYTRCADIKNS